MKLLPKKYTYLSLVLMAHYFINNNVTISSTTLHLTLQDVHQDTRKVVINVSEALLQTLSTLINEDYNQLHLIKQ